MSRLMSDLSPGTYVLNPDTPLSAVCDESGHRSHLSRDIGLTPGSSASGRALAFGCASSSWRGPSACPGSSTRPDRIRTGSAP